MNRPIFSVGMIASLLMISAITWAQEDKPAEPIASSADTKPFTRGSMPMPKEAEDAMRLRLAEMNRLMKKAQALLAAGKLREAEKTSLQAVDATPFEDKELMQWSQKLLLADIYVAQKRYAKALPLYLQSKDHVWRNYGEDLNIAFCYLRLGNFAMAKKFYSPDRILRFGEILPEDLPSTDTKRGLEANILLARGVDFFFRSRPLDAQSNLMAARKLAPKNGVISYFIGKSLDDQDRLVDAEPYLREAAEGTQLGIARLARMRLGLPLSSTH